jgi:hypothetical protein
MRSDTQTSNGLAVYALNTTQSSSSASIATSVASISLDTTVYPLSDNTTGFPYWYNATGAYVGTPHYTRVDETPPNDGIDGVITGDNTSQVYDDYQHTTFTLGSGKIIAYIIVYFRLLTEYLTSIKHASGYVGLKSLAGTRYLSAAKYADTVWTTYNYKFDTDPSTSVVWTQTGINNARLSISGKSYLSAEYYYAHVSTVWMEIYTYTDVTVQYSTSVLKRASDGIETTIASNIANVSCLMSVLPASNSTTWACPQTALLSTDSVICRVYQRVGTGAWIFVANFTTMPLDATQLDSATWTIYYYMLPSQTTSIISSNYYFGTSTYNSRIETFTWTVAAPSKAWHAISIWTENLIVRQWNITGTWSESLISRSWNLISTWTTNLITRQWTSISTWSFDLKGKGWTSISTWSFGLNTGATDEENFLTFLFFLSILILALFIIFYTALKK